MKIVLFLLVAAAWLCTGIPVAQSAPCLIVTLTGSGGGPPTFKGLAGPGTLVQYGDDSNHCNAVKLQFDAGRGTNNRRG
jgi:ribonuclease Z